MKIKTNPSCYIFSNLRIIRLFSFIGFILFISSFYKAYSLTATDTIANISLANITRPRPNTFEFDLKIKRLSNIWERFGNGSYQIQIDNLNNDSLVEKNDFQFIPTNSKYKNADSLTFPKTNYNISTKVKSNRLSVSIIDPDEFSNCDIVPLDSFILISRFKIILKDTNDSGIKLSLVEPLNYYQASSYKLNKDSLIDFIEIRNINDNIEMRNLSNTTDFSMSIEDDKATEFILKYFKAEYIGSKKVLISFETISEYEN